MARAGCRAEAAGMADTEPRPPVAPTWLKVGGVVLVTVIAVAGLAVLAWFVGLMILMSGYGSNK